MDVVRRPILMNYSTRKPLCRCGDTYDNHGTCTKCGSEIDQVSLVMTRANRRIKIEEANRVNLKKWYEVVKDEFPHKCVSECDFCKLAVHPGQIVYIDKKKAVDLKEPYFVMHKECMQDLLAAAPNTQYEQIRDRVQSGGPLF